MTSEVLNVLCLHYLILNVVGASGDYLILAVPYWNCKFVTKVPNS